MVVRSISITLFLFALLVDRAFGVDCSFDRINLTAICKNVKDLREISNQIQSNWIRLVIENTVGAVVDVPGIYLLSFYYLVMSFSLDLCEYKLEYKI